MAEEYNFGKELVKSLDGIEDKSGLIEIIFKGYVAKLLEILMDGAANKNALESSMLEEVRGNLIVEFRKAPLESNQKSVKMYEDIFDKAMQEILNVASHAHKGEDIAEYDKYRQFSINKEDYFMQGGGHVDNYIREGGLYRPR